MWIERLKEDIRNIEYDIEYGEEQNQGRIAVNVNCLRSVIDFTNAAIARQSMTTEEVAGAIEYFEDTLQFITGEPQEKDHRLAIAALQAYQPWVSVEDEKPESEKPVLLFCKVRPINRKYICVGFYAKPKSAIIPCYDDSNCEYDKETDEYYLQEGYYEVVKNWGDYSSIVIDDFVTHWKPIPEPPKGE